MAEEEEEKFQFLLFVPQELKILSKRKEK